MHEFNEFVGGILLLAIGAGLIGVAATAAMAGTLKLLGAC